MKKISHWLLGKYLIDDVYGLCEHKYERAFLWGCIEPDFNLLTYIKGTKKIQPFRGHNFKSSKKCMQNIIIKLQKSEKWGILEYYRLGKLIHYISDAFTYPHNEIFKDSIKEHRNYEMKLQGCLIKYIFVRQSWMNEFRGQPVNEIIFITHQQYLKSAADLYTDVNYIIKTSSIVYQILISKTSNYCKTIHF